MGKPIKKFRAGNVEVAVWENKSKEGDKKFQSFTVQKFYKDGEEFKNTNSLFANELPKAILALQKAYESEVLKEGSE